MVGVAFTWVSYTMMGLDWPQGTVTLALGLVALLLCLYLARCAWEAGAQG